MLDCVVDAVGDVAVTAAAAVAAVVVLKNRRTEPILVAVLMDRHT